MHERTVPISQFGLHAPSTFLRLSSFYPFIGLLLYHKLRCCVACPPSRFTPLRRTGILSGFSGSSALALERACAHSPNVPRFCPPSGGGVGSRRPTKLQAGGGALPHAHRYVFQSLVTLPFSIYLRLKILVTIKSHQAPSGETPYIIPHSPAICKGKIE